MRFLWGTDSFQGITVAIKGITGKVGPSLAEDLASRGAKLIGSYWEQEKGKEEKVERMIKEFGVKIVSDQDIFRQKYDILSLNAIGKDLNSRTIPLIPKGTIVGGAANNQLAEPRDYWGDVLFENGVWYIPDFVINLGGVVNVSDELKKGGYNETRAMRNIKVVEINVPWILSRAQIQRVSPHRIADMLPRAAIKEARQNKYEIK